jgi:hypothetical protein
MEDEPSALTLLHQTILKIEYLLAQCTLGSSPAGQHGTKALFNQSTIDATITIISLLRELHSEKLSRFINASCMPALVLAAKVCSTRLTSGGPEDGAEALSDYMVCMALLRSLQEVHPIPSLDRRVCGVCSVIP